jgi:hypothetical protein
MDAITVPQVFDAVAACLDARRPLDALRRRGAP